MSSVERGYVERGYVQGLLCPRFAMSSVERGQFAMSKVSVTEDSGTRAQSGFEIFLYLA